MSKANTTKEDSKLSSKDVARAMTNDPALSTAEYTLGDRTFKIVDLAYDDYVLFLSHLHPLIEMVTAKLASYGGVQAELPALNITGLLKYCAESMPEMALLVVKQTEPDITVEELKALAKSPFKLAGLVMEQVRQNQIIEDIGNFFVQILPLLPISPAK